MGKDAPCHCVVGYADARGYSSTTEPVMLPRLLLRICLR